MSYNSGSTWDECIEEKEIEEEEEENKEEKKRRRRIRIRRN